MWTTTTTRSRHKNIFCLLNSHLVVDDTVDLANNSAALLDMHYDEDEGFFSELA